MKILMIVFLIALMAAAGKYFFQNLLKVFYQFKIILI